ncbi:MAG: hypothetical protein K2G76_08950, partial [Prevotella sp.]|nr:hypothetical protein [Prevotella sp.]
RPSALQPAGTAAYPVRNGSAPHAECLFTPPTAAPHNGSSLSARCKTYVGARWAPTSGTQPTQSEHLSRQTFGHAKIYPYICSIKYITYGEKGFYDESHRAFRA